MDQRSHAQFVGSWGPQQRINDRIVQWQLGRDLKAPSKSKSNHLRGRLRDMQGNTVDSDQRAETLAEYFAKVQWAVRQVDLT